MHSQPTKAKRRTKTKAPGVYRSISGSYEIAYYDSDGRKVFKTTGTSFKEAKAARADVTSKLAKGEPVRDSNKRFAEFAGQVVDGLNKRPRTIEKHDYHLRKHLLPTFGEKRLAEITTNDVAQLIAKLSADGAAAWTILGALSTLGLVMRRAKRQGLIPANPVADLEKDERPSLGQTEKRSLDREEIAQLLARSGDTFRPLVSTMIFTGLRLGEALGLQWQSIDFENKLVHVRSQLDRTGELSPLKTGASRRDVVLMDDLATVLRKHREQAFARGRAKPTDLVFVNPDGSPRSHYSTGRGLKRAFERAGLGDGLSSHTFRHTFASLLIVGLRYDPVRVAKQLGHTKASFTQDTYAHLYEETRHGDEMREAMSSNYGHLLNVTEMSLAPDFAGSQGQPTKIKNPHVSVG